MSAPTKCVYCDGEGNSAAGGACGFCDHGKPLDTQGDWDASWGRVQRVTEAFSPGGGFAEDMRAKGIHVGLGKPGVCVTCGETWPCPSSRPPTQEYLR